MFQLVKVHPKLRFGQENKVPMTTVRIIGPFLHQSAKPLNVQRPFLAKWTYQVPVNWKLLGSRCFWIYLYMAVSVKPFVKSGLFQV